ncbi:MAG: polyprenol monophosphomannose synthase [Ichthyobacteriaceae bacterium]|nr:polyprenol monophosphomannose synthase [Ichthyobacteriaceae bacterium]
MNDSLVIIPTYNEKENIALIIEAVFSEEKNFDVLVVDDNSPDGTSDIVTELISKYNSANNNRLHIEKRLGKNGLGTAYIHGFKWGLAKGYDYFIEMDADFSHNPKDLIRLYNACKVDGNDVSIGSRYIKGVNVVNWPMKRVLLSYFASKYVRLITSLPIEDSTAGFVCYKRNVLEIINLNKIKFVGYAFQIEMKFKSWQHGFKLFEVPVIFTDRTMGESKMNRSILTEAIFGIINMKIRSWFTKYEKVNQ